MNKLPLVLILLITTYTCAAQSRVKEKLRSGNVTILNNFLRNRDLNISEKRYREIIPEYFEECFRLEDKTEQRVTDIDLIVHGNQIVCWYLNKPLLRDYPNSVDSFFDQKAFHPFELAFLKKYHRPIYKNDLFVRSLFSTDFCGTSGNYTREMEAVEEIISLNDTTLLEKWLRSANVEKQLYAVYGLSKLHQKHISINPESLDLIDYISHKEGNTWSCRGCHTSNPTIIEALRESGI
jgi:hypothetical protein